MCSSRMVCSMRCKAIGRSWWVKIFNSREIRQDFASRMRMEDREVEEEEGDVSTKLRSRNNLGEGEEEDEKAAPVVAGGGRRLSMLSPC